MRLPWSRPSTPPPATQVNPVVPGATAPRAAQPAAAAPAQTSAASGTPAAASQSTTLRTTGLVSQSPPFAQGTTSPTQSAGADTSGAAAGFGQLDLEFAGPSWVEVRDARGEVLMQRTHAANERQTLKGKLPLSLRIGNASVVRLQFDGKPVDLAPHTRAEIARLTLPLQRP